MISGPTTCPNLGLARVMRRDSRHALAAILFFDDDGTLGETLLPLAPPSAWELEVDRDVWRRLQDLAARGKPTTWVSLRGSMVRVEPWIGFYLLDLFEDWGWIGNIAGLLEPLVLFNKIPGARAAKQRRDAAEAASGKAITDGIDRAIARRGAEERGLRAQRRAIEGKR